MTESYCLNLHERYAPDWGTWECVRELFSNARDACPVQMSTRTIDANTLEIHTPTVPNIAELFIIGCGTKEAGGDTIGQFGEGLKLTALAATRKPGGSLTIRLPEETIRFSLKNHFGQRVLFADIERNAEPADGYLCTLVMEGAGYALNGKIIEGSESHVIAKDPTSSVQVFCKGIWICALDERDALFSYNLNGITLNRDRSHADPWSTKREVGNLLLAQMDNVAEKLVQSPQSWESDKCLEAVTWSASDGVKNTLAEAMRKVYGPRVVVGTDGRSFLDSAKKGYKPVTCGEGLADLLQGLIPTDAEVIQAIPVQFEERVVNYEWRERVAELTRLAEIVDMTGVEIKIFADHISDLLGKAEQHGRVIWLNERLFHTDNRFERVRTFIHELAHIQSRSGDESQGFEYGLDLIGGKLALRVLDFA